MTPWRVAILLLVAGAGPVRAQRVSAGLQLAFADYAEQGASLRFAGAGASGQVTLGWRRYSVSMGAARLALTPTARGEGDAAEPFDLVQTDVRLRVGATRLVSVEAGFVSRNIEPLHAAQALSAARVGAVLAFPLAVGSDGAVRASYLGGGKFSGGGSAPFGVEVGLAASYAPWSERIRATGDLEFQRLDRRITTAEGSMAAPIQSSVARVGVMVSY